MYVVSNAKLTRSTENLTRGVFRFDFLRGTKAADLDDSVDSNSSKEIIRDQIERIEREESALREMHDLYR